MAEKAKRKYYIDNLRWLSIVILIPFHAAMAWNSWGEGNYIYFEANKYLSSFMMLLSPWYMPILFVLAGMSARYALERRNYLEFAAERVKKLLLPLLAGIRLVVPVMAYYAERYNDGYSGNYFEHFEVFFTKCTDLTGYDGGFTPGHLWFLLYLFLISFICLGIIALQRRFAPSFRINNIPAAAIMLMCVISGAAQYGLNYGGKSFCKFIFLFWQDTIFFLKKRILTDLRITAYLPGLCLQFLI